MTTYNPPIMDSLSRTYKEGPPLPRKRTFRLNHANGPFIFDVWQPKEANNAPPILLVHGWGNSGGYWQGTAQVLSETTALYVPDLLGTGRSQPVRKAQNMFDQVNSLIDLLDKLKIERVQIVGHSMGSAMSLLLADAWAGHVERLVLTSMCFFLNDEQVKVYTSIMKAMKLMMRFRAPWMATLPGMYRLMGSRYFYKLPDDHQVLQQGLVDYLELDFDTAVACADNASDPAILEAGKRITCPTLLVACRQDQVMPVQNVEFTQEQIQDCQVRWINHCGHLPMVEKPSEYMEILRGFLQL